MRNAVMPQEDVIDPRIFGLHEVLPRAAGRNEPVSDWRRQLALLGDSAAKLIMQKGDPETASLTARELGEDIHFAVQAALRQRFGHTFDPLIDGPPG